MSEDHTAPAMSAMSHTSETERPLEARAASALSPTGTSDVAPNARITVMQLDRPGDSSVFASQTWEEAGALIARYPAGRQRSALLPLLHLVQSVQDCVTPDGIAFCSEVLGLTKAQVAAVATFYTMYKRVPVGQYLVSVCTNTLCGLLGGDEIYQALSAQLGVGMNETTADGVITLEHAECLAACDYAPVVTVNYEFFDNQTVDSASQLAAALREGQRPQPTRGAPLCSFREIERQIAGLGDPRPQALTATATGAGTEVGLRLALQRGESAPGYSEGAHVLAARQAHERAIASSGKPVGSPSPVRQTSAHDQGVLTFESDPAAGVDATPGSAPTSGGNS